MTHAHEIAARLDAKTADHRLLDHPFYKAWSQGTLTTTDLGYYSTQYWRQVEAFPGYLETLASRMGEGDARRIVLDNLSDERDDDHPGLWLEFAGAVGAEADAVKGAEVEPETERCVETFARAAADAPLPFALGMLYGYESQTPAVAATKIQGLRQHYGIDGEGLTYFQLHGELDVEHSAELTNALSEVIQDDKDLALAEAGASAGATAIWGLLDGVARVRAIAC